MRKDFCFIDRADAGRQIAEKIKEKKDIKCNESLVIGMPRGGVMVASVVAKALKLPLDLVVAGKIRSPLDSEVIIGAVAQDGSSIWNEKALNALATDYDYRVSAMEREHREVLRRLAYLRREWPPLNVKGKDVILVDDGMATGYTMRAAIACLKGQEPAGILLAIPVAPVQVAESLKELVDDLICLATPEPFGSVGQYYADFPPVTDEDVKLILSMNNDQKQE